MVQADCQIQRVSRQTRHDTLGCKGYAVGFQGLVNFIVIHIPSNEVIEQAIWREVTTFREIAVREHQSSIRSSQRPGRRVMIELCGDRIEISNPGLPFIPPDRLIDERLGVCEEKGSGVNKVINAAGVYQLPAPDFRVSELRTSAILFARKDFEDMDRNDRIRACYQHCCLR